MVRTIAAACLLAALSLSGVARAWAADPITVFQMRGWVTSSIPDAQKYKPGAQLVPNGGATSIGGTVQYRPTAPAVTIVAAGPLTSLVQGTSDAPSTGSIAFAYDANANTTTITLSNSAEQARVVLPVDLQQVFSDQDARVAAKILALGGSFSGSVGNTTYQGKLISYPDGSMPPSAYQLNDTNGSVIFYAQANNGGMPNIRIPCAISLTPVFGTVPATTVLPPNCGSGTFSQNINGQTISGTFQPESLIYLQSFFDGSQDRYWSTH